MFTVAFLCQLVFLTAALARPSGLGDRIARRREGAHMSQPKQAIESSVNTTSSTSINWAGGVLVADSGTYKSVTGTFIVPTPSAPSGSDSDSYSASAWVGIDGDTCDTAILQTGIDFTVSGGEVSYSAWFEYWPQPAVDFQGMTINPGDTIRLTVTATSTTTGQATVENVSNGESLTKLDIDGPTELCLQNAEWIVEDYDEGDSQVAFANFGTVTFTDTAATTHSSSDDVPFNTEIINIEQNGQVLTDVSMTGSSVVVTYV